MSVPAAPTIASIVTEGLKRGGVVAPTAGQIADATEHQFREVKADIMAQCSTHPLLQLSVTSSTVAGEQRYALPSDCHIPVSLQLLNAVDEYRGTVVSATSTTVVLAATFPATDDEIQGKYVLITGGTGVDQYRQIRGYVAATQTATVSPAWTTPPDGSSTYLVVTRTRYLWKQDMETDFDREPYTLMTGEPFYAAQFADEFHLCYVPDKQYGLLFKYYIDLDQIDDAAPVFLMLLRKWRSLWVQGVAVKTMQRYDEDRYQLELQVYNEMLSRITSQTLRIGQVQYRD